MCDRPDAAVMHIKTVLAPPGPRVEPTQLTHVAAQKSDAQQLGTIRAFSGASPAYSAGNAPKKAPPEAGTEAGRAGS